MAPDSRAAALEGRRSTHAAIGYARVSTVEQEQYGQSLDAQAETLRHHARARGLELVDVVCEHGSGRDLARDGLHRTLERLLAGDAHTLIACRLDRLTRSLPDFCRLVEWFREHDRTLIVLDFDLDTSTPGGELVAHMMAALAQWQRRVIAENTRQALAHRRATGQPVNQGSVADHPDLVNLIRQEREIGSSYREICDQLNAQHIPTIRGGTQWRPSAIGAVLGVKRERRSRATTLPTGS